MNFKRKSFFLKSTTYLLLDEPLVLLTLCDEVRIAATVGGRVLFHFAWQKRRDRAGVLRRNPSGPAGWHQFPWTGSVVIEPCFIAPLDPYICCTIEIYIYPPKEKRRSETKEDDKQMICKKQLKSILNLQE